MQEYERFESGRIGLKESLFSPLELLHEVCAEVRLQLPDAAEVVVDDPPGVSPRPEGGQALATGDRELLRRALGILVTVLRRRPGSTLIRMQATQTDAGIVFQLASNGQAIPAGRGGAAVRPIRHFATQGPDRRTFRAGACARHRGRPPRPSAGIGGPRNSGILR